MTIPLIPLDKRFRGYLPVVVDIETAGFNAKKHAMLEIAAVIVEYDANCNLTITERHAAHVIRSKTPSWTKPHLSSMASTPITLSGWQLKKMKR